jgi:repressor LexA
MGVTPKQKRALAFIRRFIQKHDYSPTLDEIARGLGLTKPGAQVIVRGLQKSRVIRKQRYEHRSIQLVGEGMQILGTVAAGSPIEPFEEPTALSLPWWEEPDRQGHYALRVSGDSMEGDGILDGDYVVLESRDHARNGETVVAMLEDGTVTLKRFYKEKSRIRLEPRNPKLKPFYATEVRIRGVVRAVLRKLD